MKMKKLGAIVLAGLMAVSLVGCGGNSSSKNEKLTLLLLIKHILHSKWKMILVN